MSEFDVMKILAALGWAFFLITAFLAQRLSVEVDAFSEELDSARERRDKYKDYWYRDSNRITELIGEMAEDRTELRKCKERLRAMVEASGLLDEQKILRD